jgi:hypothetical protein
MADSQQIDIDFPKTGELVVHVNPDDIVSLTEIELANLVVEIVGSDVVLINPETGARIVFPDLALYIFSPDESPQFFLDGREFDPAQFLNKAGIIRNVSSEDSFMSFTSLEVNPKFGEEEHGKTATEVQEQKDAEEEIIQLEDAEGDSDVEAFLAEIGQTEDDVIDPVEPLETGVPVVDSPSGGRQFFTPPPDPVAAPTQTFDPIPVIDDEIEDFTDFVVDFAFSGSVVQTTTEVDTSGSTTVLGGGGSTAGQDDSSGVRQQERETISLLTETGDHVIYGDNPLYFTETTMGKNLVLSPELADGFNVSEIRINGLPLGVEIYGYTAVAGVYTIPTPPMNADGEIELPFVFDIGAVETFDMIISMDAVFDPTSGFDTPDDPVLSSGLSQQVRILDATSSADYNVVDGNGVPVWIIDNAPIGDDIFSGSGNATIFGTMGDDVIVSQGGDDVIDAWGGDDNVFAGTGNDTIDGGDGQDVLSFANMANAVVVDLRVVDGDGYSTVTQGGDVNLVKGFEDFIGTQAADVFYGDANDNAFVGGLGDDTFYWSAGSNVYLGEAGNDALD